MKQDHEAVRTLAISIGVRPAARQLNLNENTVRQWSRREHWFKTPDLPPTHNESKAVTSVTKPGDVLLSEMQEHEGETRLSLARAHRKHAKSAEQGVYEPKETLDIARGAAITHKWDKSEKDQAQVAVNIAILNT